MPSPSCDSGASGVAVHSVQNDVDNSVPAEGLVGATVDARRAHHRSHTCDDNHTSRVTAGQRHGTGEPGGQGPGMLVHTQLWTTLWKYLDIVVDNGVDMNVHNPSVHVRTGSTGEIDRKQCRARHEGVEVALSSRRRVRTRSRRRAWEVPRCGGA
jgi:hypothetical protein